MPINVVRSNIRIIPRDKLVYEAVQIGEVQAHEAFTNLVMEATIAVDRPELAAISKIPEIAQGLKSAVMPQQKVYKPTDLRAKVPEIRKAQFLQAPVIDHIIESYKESVLEAVENKFASLTPEWQAALFGPNRENMTYAKDPKALQLSKLTPNDIKNAAKRNQQLWPDATQNWRFIYVEITINLGDATKGFLGAIANEARQAYAAGTMNEAGEGQIQWQSSLTGLDSALRGIDPYSGVKMSSTEVKSDIGHYLLPDEGYDIHVREGILDRVQETLDVALETEVASVDVNDDGVFTFLAPRLFNQPEEGTAQDKIAQEMDPEAMELEPDDSTEAPEADFGGAEEAPEADL